MGIEQRRPEPEQSDARPDRESRGLREGDAAGEAPDGGEGDVAAEIRARGRTERERGDGDGDGHQVRDGVLGALEVAAAVVEVAEVAKVAGPLL